MEALKATVITVSDRVSRGEAEDRSGPTAMDALVELGFVVDLAVVSDGVESVEAALRGAVAAGAMLVVTTGGTGMARRDLTPEGTRRVEAEGVSDSTDGAAVAENLGVGVADELLGHGAAELIG